MVVKASLESARWRVAVVTETYAPEINGVALTVQRVVQGLCARGHHVMLVRPQQADEVTAAAQPGLTPVLTRGVPIPQYPQLRLGLPAQRRLLRLWRRERPDVVHVATEGPLGWSAVSAAKRLGIPVSTDFRTNFHAYSSHYGWGFLTRAVQAYLRYFHNRADSTMVPTDGLRERLGAQGFERLLTVGRGVDSQLFSPEHRSESLRAQWGAAEHDLVVLYVGRLAAEKNLQLLAQAWGEMVKINPALKLVVVGDGPLRDAVLQWCPQAVMAGMRTGADLAAHYASADRFVFPSTTETYGNVTPEAMASGLAVLGYDYAAAAQWVRQGVNGWKVAMDDEDAFIETARMLARPNLAVDAARVAARVSAIHRDWDQIVAQIESHWRGLLSRSEPAHDRFAAFRVG
jgi:glycosyltransferase involved in cell wall biosynthesis